MDVARTPVLEVLGELERDRQKQPAGAAEGTQDIRTLFSTF